MNSDFEKEFQTLETKQNAIVDVKNRFNQIIKRRIGALLLEGISEILESENLSQDCVKILKLPIFLKPIFNFFTDNQLLLESSLLYIIYSLELLNPEMQEVYEQNLAKIEKRKKDLLELGDLLWVNIDSTTEFICKFNVPTYMSHIFHLLEDAVPNLVVFGLLRIFQWMNLLSFKVNSLVPKYEQSFSDVLQDLSR